MAERYKKRASVTREERPGRLVMLTRAAQLEDALAINEISIERRNDVVPGYPDYAAIRISWFREHGVDEYQRLISDAQREPKQHFAHVAVIDDKVVGCAFGEAPPNDEFTWWKGILVAQDYERTGVGTALETKRQAWAQGMNRPVRVLVVRGNNRSMDFFRKQGFQPVDTQGPTQELPLDFDVLELHLPTSV